MNDPKLEHMVKVFEEVGKKLIDCATAVRLILAGDDSIRDKAADKISAALEAFRDMKKLVEDLE